MASPATARTAAYYGAFVALGMTSASLGPTLPGLAEHARSPLGQVSFLFTARLFGHLLGALLGGRLYDRAPGHVVMSAALVGMAASAALVPLTPSLWALTVVLLLLGVAEGAVDAGGNTLLVWSHGRRSGPFLNGLHFCYGLGAFLAPIVVARAMLAGGLPWSYWALALLVLPAAFWPSRLASPERRARAPEGEVARAWDPRVPILAVFMFLYSGSEAAFGGWVFTYARSLGMSEAGGAAYVTSTFWGAFTLGRLLAVPIAARVGPRPIVVADLALCLASLGLIALRPGSTSAAWVGAFGVGLGMASIFPTAIAFAEQRMAITGRVTGWFLVGASAGGMVIPWLIGQLLEPTGPRAIVMVTGAALAAALAVFAALAFSPLQRAAGALRADS
jgi:FHS family Na+ dependent glucose MFS transporter 1